MMTPSTLLLASSSLIILSLHFLQTCHANCTPSACGNIRNISNPFRLKHDPKHCGDRRFELTCENDVVSLSLNSQKFYVKEINYLNSSIRVVDASININDTCSFPNSSAYHYNFTTYSYASHYPYSILNYSGHPYHELACPINVLSCPHHLLKNSSLFTEITHCRISNCNSSHPRFTYVKVGHLNASDVMERCRVEMIVMTSWRFRDAKNVSVSEIHDSLLYGFELYTDAELAHPLAARAKMSNFLVELLWILGIVGGLACAGISPPVMTIIGFVVVSLLASYSVRLLLIMIEPVGAIVNGLTYLPLVVIQLVIVFVVVVPRFVIFPFALWLLINKFRRRHLSVYNTIESFLQSDNKIAPIRYSYSNIRQMTRGFQDKLGEGGYGSVYKGKLRSGHDVAVKLLGKSGANGQDFINEIATIGRIHHVNVIKLIGYCAQGSKHALVFDFMPNGSLEKYIFTREKNNFLNLDTKFEIAVGVARGIEYLHRGCDVQILHFDIKPHNILLDDKFIPKITDFGLAKVFSIDKNTVSMTAARGTIGYVAPELISRSIGAVSYKADVYSFGMLLMEMVSLKRDLIGNNDDSDLYFPYWIYDYLNQGKDIEVENGDNDNERKLSRKMTIVALWCTQMSPDDRPSMTKVLEMLENDVERLQIPDHPSQSTHIIVNVDRSESTYLTNSVPFLSRDVSSCFEIRVQE